jgi:hypothetical protein
MLADLRTRNRELTQFLRSTHDAFEKHNEFANTSLVENWIDEAERRTWFLSETIRGSEDHGAGPSNAIETKNTAASYFPSQI